MSVSEITAAELQAAIQSGSTVIDVRETDEYESGHVPAALSVPLGAVPNNLDLFRSSGNVYVVCHSGGRSLRACEFLHDQGVTSAVNVSGGTAGWIALGNPVHTGLNP